MVRRLSLISIVFTGLILLPCSSPAAGVIQHGNSLRGKVRNSAGSNMPRVYIELQTGNGLMINQTVTTNEGDFFFPGLTDSSYIVVASAPDYNRATERVEFAIKPSENSPGESRMVEITLIPIAGERGPSTGTTFTQRVPQAAREALSRAVKLSKEGKSQDAISAMQEAVAIFPDYFDARFALGNELMQSNRLDEAIEQFEQARKINSKDARVYQAFGLIMMRQHKFAVAAAAFAEAARWDPINPQIPLMRGTSLIDHASQVNPAASKEASAERDRALAMAEKDLIRAFELSGKKLAAVHLQMARLYEKKGDLRRAADELERYLQMTSGATHQDSIREAIKKLRNQAGEKKP